MKINIKMIILLSYMKAKTIVSEILLVLVTILWGLGFIFQSIGGSYLDIFSFNFCRNILATIFIGLILLVLLIYKKKKNMTNKDEKSPWLGGFLIGLSLIVAMSLQQWGINMEGAGKSGFITALYVVLVPILSLFFGKKLNVFISIAIVFALTGLYLINVTDAKFTFTWGTLALLACAFAYSIQIMLIDHFSKTCDVIKLSFVEFLTASVLSFPLMLIFGHITLEGIKNALPSILYLGIASSGIAYTLQIVTQKYINVTVASIIMSLESVFSIIFALIFLKENHTYIQYIGCALILVAVILAQLTPKKRTVKQNESTIN